MWMVRLIGCFLFSAPALAESGFSKKYERDYNSFNPLIQYRPDNPLDPLNRYNPVLRADRPEQTAGLKVMD